MLDAVLSVHRNPHTCGVTKWNVQLAAHLGVPEAGLETSGLWTHPLLSVKFSEWIWRPSTPTSYALFLHDAPMTDEDWRVVGMATQIYAANPVIARSVAKRRPDVVTACCPATIQGNPDRGGYRVLTFGMAHKIACAWHEALAVELEREHPDYTISLSTAVHEGSPWDTALTESVTKLRRIYGDKLRVLGYLGDDALAKEIQDCDAVALFYEPALRANHTTAWAVLDAGKRLITNTDADSPALECGRWPSWPSLLETLGVGVSV